MIVGAMVKSAGLSNDGGSTCGLLPTLAIRIFDRRYQTRRYAMCRNAAVRMWSSDNDTEDSLMELEDLVVRRGVC
jgi:hypothetical protein